MVAHVVNLQRGKSSCSSEKMMAAPVLCRNLGVWSKCGSQVPWRWTSSALNYDGSFQKPAMKTPVPGPKSKVKLKLTHQVIIPY